MKSNVIYYDFHIYDANIIWVENISSKMKTISYLLKHIKKIW